MQKKTVCRSRSKYNTCSQPPFFYKCKYNFSEKSERTDVSSSSSRNRRNRNKSKTDVNDEDSGAEERKSDRWDEDDDLPLKTESEKSTDHVNRPTRTSKTMSKYYKSPGGDKALSTSKSQHAMGRRSTRHR